MSDINGWPDPERPGVPLNPKETALHYISEGVALWLAREKKWSLLSRTRSEKPEWVAAQPWAEYIGPCPTPEEVEKLRAERDALQKERDALKARIDAINKERLELYYFRHE